jgi:hypothetical protein
MNRRILLVAVALLAVCASLADGAIRIVRTGTTYSTVAAAASASIDGDTIEIDSGTYSGTTVCTTFYRNNLTLRGVGSTRPILDAGGTSAQGKGIWVIAGAGATVEFLEFQNCHVVDKNGAGIRQEGANLTVRNCYFHDNENGILSGANTSSTILIETCEFNHNGYGDGYSHQIYIGNVGQLTVRYCYFHHGWKGQEIKTRAQVNYILYNRITCEDGYSNYEVNIPNGGTSYVIGNLIHQGPNTTNSTIVDYASEGATNPDQHLYVVNNTIVNTRGAGTFVRNMSTVDALLQNNIFQGVGTVLSGPGTQVTNWVTSNAYLASASTYDFHLTASSTGAIDAGTAPGTGINGFAMTPVLQYVHPRSSESRPANGVIDIGCYEYGGAPTNQAPQVNAGNDQSITWPANSVNLDGTVTDDGLPNPPAAVTTIWSKVSGPGTATFGNVYAVDTTATFSQSGTYVLQLLADDSALQASDTVTITVSAAAVDTVASGETPVYGTVTGSYLDTQSSNNVYESIREVIRGGGNLNYSWLEHKWTFSVPTNSSVTFYLEAYRPANSDNDNFTFAYSTNGTSWTNMVTVTKTADDNAYQTYALPAGTSGTVYVRVIDTNRQKNKTSLDSIYVDHMFFRSQP